MDSPHAAALRDYEREAGIDLVVLCSHGRTGLVRFALGSVADDLLHHGTAPLLLVWAFGNSVRLEQAVVSLDGIERTRALAALGVVTELAGRLLREVTLLAVIAAPEARAEAERYLASAAQRIPHDGLRVACRVEQGDPASVIVDVAGADRLVELATHGRSGLTRWALGSVAERVAHAGAAGVLLVRAGTPAALASLPQADAAVRA